MQSSLLGMAFVVAAASCDDRAVRVQSVGVSPNDHGGALRWRLSTGDEIHSTAAVNANGTIYVGSNDKNVYALAPDGTKKWALTTEDRVESSPAIGADGRLYVGSRDETLYAIGP
jgi:outer membrane protein assembly factor BamB